MALKISRLPFVVVLLSLLAGCATPCCDATRTVTVTTTTEEVAEQSCGTSRCKSSAAVTPATAAAPNADAPQTVRLLATGYGASGAYSRYTQGQRELMAIRAAQVDAYRNLAEQVYGFRVWGNTAVSAFATQNDSVRTYVDAFIRGARVVNLTTLENGNYEATVELVISSQFLDCVQRQGRCTAPVPAPAACFSAGCTAPGVTYVGH